MSKPSHIHCFNCGKPIYVEDEQEVPAMVTLMPVPGPGNGIAFTQVPRPLCDGCAENQQQAAQKAAEEAEAAKARSRLVVARGPVRPL